MKPWPCLALVVLATLFVCGCLDRPQSPSAEQEAWPELRFVRIVGGVSAPTHITHAGDGSGRLFIVEQNGRVMIVKNGVLLPHPFLDIRRKVRSGGERGLLSIAFPPGYAEKRHFYVNYTDRNGDTIIARYRTEADPDRADPASGTIVLLIPQPFSNHNGGQLAFGPDGYLYIGMGDGGAAGDPFGNAQKPGTLLGKLVRIDTEGGAVPYGIPQTNPFVRTAGYRPEIWARGLRNPWRFSFDRATGDLYIADVGQKHYEEIHFQPAASRGGENYGWNIMEGPHCYRAKTCDRTGLELPVAGYEHDKGCSITGGMVYRGKRWPALKGIYLFGDYCSGRVWGLRRAGGAWQQAELARTESAISTFGEDEAGELYLADHNGGAVYRIEAADR